MNKKETTQLIDFLKDDRQIYRDLVFLLLDNLSKQISFKLKIQKASIQLVNELPFAVIGFRKLKDCLFIEFCNSAVIEDNLIVKTNTVDNLKIIHTVNLSPDSSIDKNILNWIKNSYELILKN